MPAIFKHIHFYGGVHPAEGKVANATPIQDAPLMDSYTVPLQMHIGAPAKLLKQKGDKVLKGERIAEPGGFVSAPIHAPTSGEITGITTCLGPLGNQIPAVIIVPDGEDKAAEPMKPLDPVSSSPDELKARVGEAGIVGMGGAAFPTLVKLSPPPNIKIDTLILNGVECEPCLTADHRLMLENPDAILAGAQVSATILGVKKIMLAIEANKPDAVELMESKAARYGIEVHKMQVRYPQGAEKQLIYALTGRKVPSGGLPMNVNCVVQNVGSAAAVGEAVVDGKPLYERVTTVTGTPIVNPSNWRLRVGTSYADAIKLAGGVKCEPAKIISGGPMMGMSVYSLDIPVMKNTSGILLMAPEEVVQYEPHPCIRCGRCNDNCPMGLMPGLLSVQVEKLRYELAEQWHVMDCIECGCCSFGCPAHRPLVQHIRRAKAEVIAKKKAASAAKK